MATDEELKKLLGEDTGTTPPAEEAPKEETPATPAPEEDPAVKAKQEQLANLDKAVKEEQERLRSLRKERKAAKPVDPEEEELPQINLEDPAAKAWDKRIREAAAPANQELEKAKEERRLYALRQFLADKPALSKNPAKIRSMMETYDRLKTSTELTSEGITMDLEKAYAAEHADELIEAVRRSRIDGARNDAIFSDVGVSRGSSSYSNEKETKPISLNDDERQILARWGMTPAEWAAEKKKYG